MHNMQIRNKRNTHSQCRIPRKDQRSRALTQRASKTAHSLNKNKQQKLTEQKPTSKWGPPTCYRKQRKKRVSAPPPFGMRHISTCFQVETNIPKNKMEYIYIYGLYIYVWILFLWNILSPRLNEEEVWWGAGSRQTSPPYFPHHTSARRTAFPHKEMRNFLNLDQGGI